MIAYLNGILAEKDEFSMVVDVNGIGYKVLASMSTLAQLPNIDAPVKIFTHTQMKDDGITLIGFMNKNEQEIFLKLISVNGVGIKGALGILSTLVPNEIILAIISNDVKALSKAVGIGQKTAQRIILELKDKCSTEDALPPSFSGQNSFGGLGGDATNTSNELDAIDALVALGYSPMEVGKVVRESSKNSDGNMAVEEILKYALKKMSGL